MVASLMLQDRAFFSTWNTENAGSATKHIVIPTSSTGTYSCTVDWGDGNANYMTTYNDSNWTHVYGSTGTYTIKIYGTFVGLVFNNGGDKAKITKVTKWGPDFRLGTTEGNYFYGCSNLTITATDVLNLQGTTSLVGLFRSCTSITTVPNIGSWDTSAVTSLLQAFFSASSFNQSLSTWNTSAVTNMQATFNGATAFNGSLSGWNTAAVTTMQNMFISATAFNQSVASFNTAAVTNMASMFNAAAAFNQSVSSFNTASVTDISGMFFGASAFNQSVSSFNTTAVTTMASMFQSATVFNQSVASFSTASVTTMASMFNSASAFNQAVSGFNTAAVTTMASMFQSATVFNQDVSGWSIASLTSAASMFSSSAFAITNYNKLLDSATGWPSQGTIHSSVTFSAGTAHYSGTNAIAGRATLVTTKTWSVSDGGTP